MYVCVYLYTPDKLACLLSSTPSHPPSLWGRCPLPLFMPLIGARPDHEVGDPRRSRWFNSSLLRGQHGQVSV